MRHARPISKTNICIIINPRKYSFVGEMHWKEGNVVGNVYNGAYSTFPLWKPNVWNTFCVMVDTANKN